MVKVISAKPSNISMMREKKTMPKYSWPWPTESGCSWVRRNSVAVTNAMNMVRKKRKMYRKAFLFTSTNSRYKYMQVLSELVRRFGLQCAVVAVATGSIAVDMTCTTKQYTQTAGLVCLSTNQTARSNAPCEADNCELPLICCKCRYVIGSMSDRK